MPQGTGRKVQGKAGGSLYSSKRRLVSFGLYAMAKTRVQREGGATSNEEDGTRRL